VRILEVILRPEDYPGRNLSIEPPDKSGDWKLSSPIPDRWINSKTKDVALKPAGAPLTQIKKRDLSKQPPDDSGEWMDYGDSWVNKKTRQFAEKPQYDNLSMEPVDATADNNVDNKKDNKPTDNDVTSDQTTIKNSKLNSGPINASMIMPVQGPLNTTHTFGRAHEGVDLVVNSGTPVKAPDAGTVRVNKGAKAGTYVSIMNAKGELLHRLMHLKQVNVSDGQQIKQGDVVGLSGGANLDPGKGNAHGAHLHWEAYANGKVYDLTSFVNSHQSGNNNPAPNEKKETPVEQTANKLVFMFNGLKDNSARIEACKQVDRLAAKIPGAKLLEYTQGQQAVAEIKKAVTANPNVKIVLFGFSKGAETAVQTAAALGSTPVALLITVAPYGPYLKNMQISSNVKRARNYYQPKEIADQGVKYTPQSGRDIPIDEKDAVHAKIIDNYTGGMITDAINGVK